MAIHGFAAGSIVEYVPEFGRNRESGSPCVVKLKYVPFVKTQEYARIIAARSQYAGDKSRGIEISQEVQKKQFHENVLSVSGFTVSGKEITTSEELWENASAGLIYELVSAMEDSTRLRAGLREEPK